MPLSHSCICIETCISCNLEELASHHRNHTEWYTWTLSYHPTGTVPCSAELARRLGSHTSSDQEHSLCILHHPMAWFLLIPLFHSHPKSSRLVLVKSSTKTWVTSSAQQEMPIPSSPPSLQTKKTTPFHFFYTLFGDLTAKRNVSQCSHCEFVYMKEIHINGAICVHMGFQVKCSH